MRPFWLVSWCWLAPCVLACSARNVSGDEVADESESATDESASATDESESSVGETSTDTGVSAEPCSCIVSQELVCDDALRWTALHECDLPSPCGVVNLAEPDAETASCVLQQLVDQDTPSRFDYASPMSGDWGNGLYVGTFYILGPGMGLDVACDHPSWDCCSPPPPEPHVAYHAINEPAYFFDCLGKSDTVMTGCIFNGLEAMGGVPICTGP